MRKYGAEAFNWSVAESFDDEPSALDAEAFWIEFLRATVSGYGFNVYNDGRGGVCHAVSESTRAKLRAAFTGRKASDETRAKLSAAHLGRRMPPRTPEWCAKISDARKREIASGVRTWGALHTPETKAKLKGKSKTLTDEQRRALSERSSRQMKERWEDPEFRERQLAIIRVRETSPESRERKSREKSEWNRRKWEDPEYRSKMTERLRQLAANRKNKS